jgi:rRNA maturation RNase YbeY
MAQGKPIGGFRLTITAAAGAAHVRFLRRELRRAHSMVSPPLEELSVALVCDRTMSDLHLRFMNIAGPTDVLTFPLEHDAKGNVLGGEVIVCVPEARRRCRELGTTLPEELLLYALHGMLHLCGFDDRTDRDFKRMHRMEDDILARLGVGAVFNAGKTDRSACAVPGGV